MRDLRQLFWAGIGIVLVMAVIFMWDGGDPSVRVTVHLRDGKELGCIAPNVKEANLKASKILSEGFTTKVGGKIVYFPPYQIAKVTFPEKKEQ
jgi:hypothetical protein